MYVKYSSFSGASSCVQGFMSRALLTLLALKKRSLTHIPIARTLTLVVPDLTFTTDGLLQKLMFVSEDDSSIWPGYTHFQVWRRTEQGFTAVNGTSTHSYIPVRSSELNVYEYTLDPPAQVQSGDFVSWEYPSSRYRWLPLVVNNTGYEIHLVTSKSNDVIFQTQLLEYHSNPLIGVQMLGKNNTVKYVYALIRVCYRLHGVVCVIFTLYYIYICVTYYAIVYMKIYMYIPAITMATYNGYKYYYFSCNCCYCHKNKLLLPYHLQLLPPLVYIITTNNSRACANIT